MAKVIDCVFQATMCACDAKCNIIPNILDRMNYTRVVKIRTWWRKWVIALLTLFEEAKGMGNKW